MKFKFLLIGFCFFLTHLSIAQQYNWWVNGQVFRGFVISHSAKVRHLIKATPEGFEINFQKELNGSQYWEKLYNKPIVNYGLSYYDLNNDAQLGKLFIASAAVDIPLARREYTNLFFRIGTGIVYSTNPYDRDSNNQNSMIGSPFTCLIQSRFTYEIKLNDYFKLTPNINITHASNGAQSLPNRGVNMVTANIGCSYRFIERILTDDILKLDQPQAYNWKFYLLLSSGKHTFSLQNRRPEAFFNLSFIAQKYLNQKSDLQLGIEYFHSLALKTNLSNDWFIRQEDKVPDFKRAGVFIGHELKANRLGFITQFGIYVYNPSKSAQPVYQRYGLKYEFIQNAIAQVGLKVHSATAEAIEFSLGYKF